MNFFWEMFRITFYLILIIAFILIVYYFLKNRVNFNKTKEMEIIDSMRLANGETLYLLKIFDEIILLGGTKENLQRIYSWPEAELEIDFEEESAAEEKSFNFKQTFLNKLQGFDKEEIVKRKQESDLDEK